MAKKTVVQFSASWIPGEKEKDDAAQSPAPARRHGFGRRRRGARRRLIVARDGLAGLRRRTGIRVFLFASVAAPSAVPISLLIHDRISLGVAAPDRWRLPPGRHGKTLQKGGGEGETEWPNASRNRQRPSL